MNESDIKYCVTAVIDLLGFSSHLEVGNDLRTSISKEAINRLELLEEVIEIFENEKCKYRKYYPSNLFYERINDAIIFTLDLPDNLLPEIGECVKSRISYEELSQYIELTKSDDLKEVEVSFKKSYTSSLIELTQFLGLVTRIHLYINSIEKKKLFPGCKTIVSSGFRKRFITKSKVDDKFSANFSFSNAFIAEKELKGAKLYIDNNILQLLCQDTHLNNIVILSSFVNDDVVFDPFDKDNDFFSFKSKYVKGNSFELNILRKNYIYRELNPSPLTYLHLFNQLLPYLNGEKKISKKNNRALFNISFEKIKQKIDLNDPLKTRKEAMFFYFDISSDIEVNKQLILTGKSSILEKQRKKEFEIKYLNMNIINTTHNTGCS